MTASKYSDDERDHALALLAEHGKAEASRLTGIPAGTIASWGHRNGVAAPTTERMAKVVAARTLSTEERKRRLAEGLLDDIERMRADLFAPTLERKVVPGGRWCETEIVTVEHPTTTHAERRTAIEAIAKALEAVQLLTGDATARLGVLTGGVDDGAAQARAQRAQAVVLELAQRAAS